MQLKPPITGTFVPGSGTADATVTVPPATDSEMSDKVTGPVHRYLLTETGISPNARKQYVKDLREKWMLDPDPCERHRLSRTFRGRLIELQYAE